MNSLILPQMTRTTFVVILQMAEHLLLSLMTIQAYHLILIRLDAQFHRDLILRLIQQAKERLIHNSSESCSCAQAFQSFKKFYLSPGNVWYCCVKLFFSLFVQINGQDDPSVLVKRVQAKGLQGTIFCNCVLKYLLIHVNTC